MKKYFFYILFLISVTSCKEESFKPGKKMVLGDSSLIVNENDSNYLKNFVDDISETKNEDADIVKMMVQVDSMKTKQNLDNNDSLGKDIKGFEIQFADFKIIFDKIETKEYRPQKPLEYNSVSYQVTKGDLAEIHLKIEGLNEVKISERVFTKLKVSKDSKEMHLSSLGRKLSDWFELAGKENVFVGVGSNSLLFENVGATKIKLALEEKLKQKNITGKEKDGWMKAIENSKSYQDAPCVLYVATAQFKIVGKTQSGKFIRTLIHLDTID